MREVITVLVLLFLVTSCGSDDRKFLGKWIEKEHGNETIEITKMKGSFLVEIQGRSFFGGDINKKYPAKIIDGMLEISAEAPVKAMIDNKGVLIVKGNEYIRYEQTTKYYENNQEDINNLEQGMSEITNESGSSECLITKVYKKHNSYLIDVDYLTTEFVVEDGAEYSKIINNNPKIRTFLLTEETMFFVYYWNNKWFGGSQITKNDFVENFIANEHQIWTIEVQDGKVRQLKEVYQP